MNIDDEQLTDEIFDLHAEFCRAIADPKRLKIISLLAKSEMNVGEIAKALGTRVSNVSQHLRVLRSRNIVQSRKVGQVVIYRLKNKRLPAACARLRTILLDGIREHGKIADGGTPGK